MAKIEVDENLCIGCGACVSACPECFELNEDGKSLVVAGATCTCDLDEVADSCPTDAIIITDKE